MKKTLLLILVIGGIILTGCQSKEEPTKVDEPTKTEESAKTEEPATTFPEKEITFIVPWGAGGITDTVARSFVAPFEDAIGQKVAVVNLSGASGAIGTEETYNKDADGYTVLFSAETPAIFKVMGTSELGFENFEPIMMMIQDTKLVVVPSDSKYNTFEELVEDIKANPGKIKMSYSSPGASGHIQGLALSNANLDVNMTPFGGGSPAMIATISGDVEFTFGNYGTVKDYLENGDLKALATFTNEQVEFLPDVPPMTDVLPELNSIFPLYFPNCLLVKEGTPQEIKDILIAAAKEAVQDERWTTFVDNKNYEQLHSFTEEEISKYWEKFTSITSWLLYDAGASVNSPEDFGIERY